jgi:hypothetical protein
VVAAVSTSGDRRPRKIKLLPVKGFRKKEVKRLVSEHLASTSRLVTDGLELLDRGGRGRPPSHRHGDRQRTAGGAVVAVQVGEHDPGQRQGGDRRTYRRISPEHAGRYLGSFAWRYNRRFQLDSLIPRWSTALPGPPRCGRARPEWPSRA